MTRAELIHQMALMTDEELENCIQIYKDGGTTKQLDDYVSRLPDDQKEQEAENIQNYLKQQKKSKRSIDELVTEAEQKNPRFIQRLNEEPKMVEFQSEEGKTEKGSHYLSWATTDNGAIVFPTIMEDELGNLKYYGDSALDEALKRGDYLEMTPEEADLFTRNYKTTKYKPWFDKWEQLYGSDAYIKEVKKHAEGGVLENVNLEQLAEELKEHEEPIYKQIKLHKEGGSIISQLIEQLEDSEVVDLLKEFNLDDLISGGIKKGHNISVEIVIEKSCKPLIKIEIGDCQFLVEVVTTDEEMEKGLSNRESLDDDKGMLFDFGEVQDEVTFNMEDCSIPLDIIFINEDNEVISIAKGDPNSEDLYTEKDVRYVLEVNQDSGVEVGDDLELDCDVMKVLAPDGSTQAILKGGERIYSRKATKKLLHWAKRCNKTKTDSDYKRLGMIMLNEIDAQDNRQPEYVSLPENK